MKNLLKNKKVAMVGAVVLAVALIVVVVVSVVNSNRTDFPDVNEGPGEEVYERSLVFYNRDILNLAYNKDFSAVVLDNIQAVIFSEEEMKFSRNNSPLEEDNSVYYDATIDAANFTSYDANICGFDVKTSDERDYKVIAGTDSLNEDFTYVYTAILREGGDKIFVFINGDKKDENAFIDFAKSKLGVGVVEVTTLELSAE